MDVNVTLETRDLEQELINSELIRSKCEEDSYAQNLYAALCNMQWQPQEVWPILKNELWSCSWRASGRIVAEIRNQKIFSDGSRNETYMDWYCSGLSADSADNEDHLDGYLSEGTVSEEIAQDLALLGWRPVPYED